MVNRQWNLIGKGIGMAIPGGNFLMGMAKQNSRENKLNAYDNAFIDMQLANQEQSIHGFGGNLLIKIDMVIIK